MRRGVAPALAEYLERDGRRVETWLNSLHTVTCAFDENPAAFDNLNTPDDLRAHARVRT